MGIVILLSTNVFLVTRGLCHQRLTTYALVPAGMLFMIGVFSYDGIIASLWCYPSIVACYCMLSQRRAWIANAVILGVSLPMVSNTLASEYAMRVAATLVAISVFSAILVRVIDRLHGQLKHQLIHDPLTGLLNRMTLKNTLEAAIDLQKNGAQASTLLAVDADHFKRINDLFGHDIGDKALKHIAKIFRAHLRTSDYAFRTGGEEFLILLDGSLDRDVNVVAEQLRKNIEKAEIIPDYRLTVSIGQTDSVPYDTWTAWVKRADNLLFNAKKNGRNQISRFYDSKLMPAVEFA